MTKPIAGIEALIWSEKADILTAELSSQNHQRTSKRMAYEGVHGVNHHANQNQNHNQEITGYDVDIFLNQENEMDYQCVMYVINVQFFISKNQKN